MKVKSLFINQLVQSIPFLPGASWPENDPEVQVCLAKVFQIRIQQFGLVRQW
jgi:hypothetical protein